MADETRIHPWKAPTVGEEIDSICSRCKEETIHRIVAMVEGRVHLVICTRCSGQHRYRPSLAALRKKVPLPTERQARALKKFAAEVQPREPLKDWQFLKELTGAAEPLPYDPSLSYRENHAILHPTFGLGFVRKVLNTSKVEVVFEHQVKILVMKRPPASRQ